MREYPLATLALMWRIHRKERSTMKRTLLTVTAFFGLATAASAATLTIEADRATYNVGDTITLSINGDAQGAVAFGVYGRLLFNGSLVDNATRVQTALGTGWAKGTLAAGDGSAEALNADKLSDGSVAACVPLRFEQSCDIAQKEVSRERRNVQSDRSSRDVYGQHPAGGAQRDHAGRRDLA